MSRKRKTKTKNEKKNHKKRNTTSRRGSTHRRGTNLKKLMDIPGLPKEVTKFLDIPNAKTFQTISKQALNDKYIQHELKSRKREFTNDSVDRILQEVLFINDIPDIQFDGELMYELHSFVGDYHFDDNQDKKEMHEEYEDYDSDDSSAEDDYKLHKYVKDYIMIMHYEYPTPPNKFIIYCPHFKTSDLTILNSKSISSQSKYDKFKKVFLSHFKDPSNFRIYNFLGEDDSHKGNYSRIKPFEFKKAFHLIL